MELLDGNSAAGPHVIYVKTPVQVVQVVQQLPGAIGFAQVALTLQKDLPELATEKSISQTPCGRSVRSAHRRLRLGLKRPQPPADRGSGVTRQTQTDRGGRITGTPSSSPTLIEVSGRS